MSQTRHQVAGCGKSRIGKNARAPGRISRSGRILNDSWPPRSEREHISAHRLRDQKRSLSCCSRPACASPSCAGLNADAINLKRDEFTVRARAQSCAWSFFPSPRASRSTKIFWKKRTTFRRTCSRAMTRHCAWRGRRGVNPAFGSAIGRPLRPRRRHCYRRDPAHPAPLVRHRSICAAAPTSARCNQCSATRRSRPRKFTPMSPINTLREIHKKVSRENRSKTGENILSRRRSIRSARKRGLPRAPHQFRSEDGAYRTAPGLDPTVDFLLNST